MDSIEVYGALSGSQFPVTGLDSALLSCMYSLSSICKADGYEIETPATALALKLMALLGQQGHLVSWDEIRERHMKEQAWMVLADSAGNKDQIVRLLGWLKYLLGGASLLAMMEKELRKVEVS